MFAIPPPSIVRIQTVPIKCGKGGNCGTPQVRVMSQVFSDRI